MAVVLVLLLMAALPEQLILVAVAVVLTEQAPETPEAAEAVL